MNLANHLIGTQIKSANELYDYLTFQRMLSKITINVWCDHREYVIESKDDPKKFDVIPVSDYDRSESRKSSNLSWFPYLKYPLLIL